MKRLAIYFYFDKDGIVGDYAVYYLQKLKEVVSEVCVVVNEPLSKEGYHKLEKVCDVLLVRENVGFDSGAYKYAIEHYGYDKIKEYDELLLNNFTSYGPIYPLQEMFDVMDKRNCDFWGINRHPEMPLYLLPEQKLGYIFEHIQSYFIILRQKILQDACFEEYWRTLQLPTTYNEAIAFHEIRLTTYLEKRGFVSSAYMDFEKYKGMFESNSSVFLADKQLIEDRNPLIKRKTFYLENPQWMNLCLGRVAKEALDYIDKKTDYDVNLIWDDLLVTQKMSVLRNNLHLNYYLPRNYVLEQPQKANVALVFFVYYDDLVDECIGYMQNMPAETTIYLISAKQDLLNTYQKKLEKLSQYSVEYRLMENRGRDVSAYLVAAADVYAKHDYICCLHDKKTAQVPYPCGKDYAFHCFENTIASPEYVQNVIDVFNKNPRLGMLVPPLVMEGNYYALLGNEVGTNEEIMQKLYKELQLTVPFDEAPVAPFGTMFWVRGKAFRSIFNHRWTYADFPDEPIPYDFTILHAIERLYPLTVQQDGYYVAWAATTDYISIYTDNLFYAHREFHKAISTYIPITYFGAVLGHLSKIGKRKKCYLQFQYKKYDLLTRISWGKKHQHYKQKKIKYKMFLEQFR